MVPIFIYRYTERNEIYISYSTSGGFFVIVKGEGAEIKESLEDTKKLLD